jgi:small-conductance mechanosensitive channel
MKSSFLNNGVRNVKSEVLYEIWRLFRQEGIQIPNPKRDLYMRSDLRT